MICYHIDRKSLLVQIGCHMVDIHHQRLCRLSCSSSGVRIRAKQTQSFPRRCHIAVQVRLLHTPRQKEVLCLWMFSLFDAALTPARLPLRTLARLEWCVRSVFSSVSQLSRATDRSSGVELDEGIPLWEGAPRSELERTLRIVAPPQGGQSARMCIYVALHCLH